MFKSLHNILPDEFTNLFKSSSDFHSYETRSSLSLRSEFARTNSRKFSIRCRGPLFWNSLPQSLKASPNINLFKINLRKWLIDAHN